MLVSTYHAVLVVLLCHPLYKASCFTLGYTFWTLVIMKTENLLENLQNENIVLRGEQFTLFYTGLDLDESMTIYYVGLLIFSWAC